MNEPKCKYADVGPRDDAWELHTRECPECREVVRVAAWMAGLAAEAQVPKYLPSPGFLMFKARIRKRQLDAARATEPFYFTTAFATLLFGSSIGWVLLRAETRFGAIMGQALSLLSGYAGFILLGLVLATLISVIGAFSLNRNRSSNRGAEAIR